MEDEDHKKYRMDKWLWAVRLFKTRSLAAQACRAGNVKIDGARVKASRAVRPGEVILIQKGGRLHTVCVRQLLDKRVGANLVAEYMEDRTPPPEPVQKETVQARREHGAGRPTKKDRREMDALREML